MLLGRKLLSEFLWELIRVEDLQTLAELHLLAKLTPQQEVR